MRFAFVSLFLLASAIYAFAAPVDREPYLTPDNDDVANATNAGLMARTNTNGNFWLYNCDTCRCDASYAYTDFHGVSGCLNVGDAKSIGLTAVSPGFVPVSTTCSVYFERDCQGSYQSVGVHYEDSWGCTDGQHDILSVQCYYQTGPAWYGSNTISNKKQIR
jgi:hypothetical protein